MKREFKTSKVMITVVLVGLAVVFAYSVTAFSTIDERLGIIIDRWLFRENVALVLLKVVSPDVDADNCFLAVHRFPSMFLPTERGLTERMFVGFVKPGDTVEVRIEIPAIPVKLETDEEGYYKISYYEPQEVFVVSACVNNGNLVYKAGRTVEIFPKSLVHKEFIDIRKLYDKADYYGEAAKSSKLVEGISSLNSKCEISLTDGRGVCVTLVGGPYLYSIRGLEVTYGIRNYPTKTLLYMESFFDITSCNNYDCSNVNPEWMYAGKKGTPSYIEAEITPWLSGDRKVRIYFMVKYIYETYTIEDSHNGFRFKYWILYPSHIGGIERADNLGESKDYGIVNYELLSPPEYAFIAKGDIEIIFGVDTKVGDDIISTSNVLFVSPEGWEYLLAVHLYASIRQDNQYTTPYVSIRDVSGRGHPWYYWWFKDDNPAFLEVLISPASGFSP